jgi:hypothetical protein
MGVDRLRLGAAGCNGRGRVAMGLGHTTRGREQPTMRGLLRSGIIAYSVGADTFLPSANTLLWSTDSAPPSADAFPLCADVFCLN